MSAADAHPVHNEVKQRLIIQNEERLLRQYLVATRASTAQYTRFRPAPPPPADGSEDAESLLGASTTSGASMSSFGGDATQQRRESIFDRRISEAQRYAVDTGDIDVLLKQMQRKHKEETKKRYQFNKVHYHRSKASLHRTQLQVVLRDEEDTRNDIELVELMRLEALRTTFGKSRTTQLQSLQAEERVARLQLERLLVEESFQLNLLLYAESEHLDEIKQVEVGSPQRMKLTRGGGAAEGAGGSVSPQQQKEPLLSSPQPPLDFDEIYKNDDATPNGDASMTTTANLNGSTTAAGGNTKSAVLTPMRRQSYVSLLKMDDDALMSSSSHTVRSPHSPNGASSSTPGSAARRMSRRASTTKADDVSWIEGFVSREETFGRNEVDREWTIWSGRVAECAEIHRNLVKRDKLQLDRTGTLQLVVNAKAADQSAWALCQTMMLVDEEQLARQHVLWHVSAELLRLKRLLGGIVTRDRRKSLGLTD